MSPWRWLVGRFRHPTPTPAVPVTPPDEHAEVRRRVDEVERETDRIQAQLRAMGLTPREKR